ncbi:DinB family protein [Flavobacterium sp.]|uniref:DinB family protein n=1 Tax=Flavobacterium sp. TaxID=239 RepID=UPI00286A066D|nr:DinB family protein [Flavobacterium sp.]
MNTTQTTVKMIFDRWNSLNKSFDEILNAVTDQQLEKEIAPNKNRGIYLLGHLVAVHDAMLPLLDFGDKLFPELADPFLTSPDKSVANLPAAKELREKWVKINDILNQNFDRLKPEQWFERHTAVSDEDFIKEPHRNKLNIMITRSTHLAYHTGQFILLK